MSLKKRVELLLRYFLREIKDKVVLMSSLYMGLKNVNTYMGHERTSI
jgi:hypothetical protein